MQGRGTPVPSLVMDLPVLHPFVRELAENERFRLFLEELPETRARVSEPALPLVVSALHEELGRPLVVLAPEDADARDIAEVAAWFLGDDQVALLPSRGVSWSSGLEPPPHLVGERARALDVLAAGGLVSASAAALAEALPPPEARPDPLARGYMGITVGTGSLTIERVEPKLPAAKAGLQSGDVVTKLNDFPTTSADGLIAATRYYAPGTKVTVTYTRDGAEHTADVTLGSL